MIDLSFNVQSTSTIPADHGYLLYSAISRVLPAAHEPNGVGIHPLRGRLVGDRLMQLCDISRLTIRIDVERIAQWLPLAGKQLKLAGQSLRVGVPEVRSLVPATALRSRLVTIKVSPPAADTTRSQPPEPDQFLAAARRQLDVLGTSASVQVNLGKRRTLRIKDKEVVGYEVLVSALTAEESLKLQENGLGGRRHMGCGVFVPHALKGDSHAS